jgi:hypothetical protein
MSVLKQNPFIESIDLLIESALNICLIYYNLLYVKVGAGNDLLLLSGMLGIWSFSSHACLALGERVILNCEILVSKWLTLHTR